MCGSAEAYPSEALRAELSVKLSLSDRQLQMWFCHRRLKDRNAKKLQNDSSLAGAPAVGEEGVEQVTGADVGRDCGLASGPFNHLDSRKIVPRPGMTAFPSMGAGLPAVVGSSYYEPPQNMDVLQVVAFVERQLGEPIREDGPILGMEFDSLPPDAFGAPIGKLDFLIAGLLNFAMPYVMILQKGGNEAILYCKKIFVFSCSWLSQV